MTLQIRSFPRETHKKLIKACEEKDCRLTDIVTPAIERYLCTGIKEKEE